MSTLAQTSTPVALDAPGADAPLVSVVIPCLNEAENIERCVRAARDGARADGRRRRGGRRRQRLRGRLGRARRAAPARAWWSSAGAATAAPTSPASPPRAGSYIVMADADLTYDFDEIPRFVDELEEGAELVMGDRMDNIQPGAMPWLHRYVGNPLLTGPAQPLLQHRRQRRPLRHARAAPRRAAAPRPAHDRHGVRLRDGDPGLEGEPEDRRVPDRIPPARRRVQALELPRRLAPPALPARAQPHAPVHRARRTAGGLRHADRGAGGQWPRPLRPRLGHPRVDRRRAADGRRHAGARARPVRARLRHVLHGRARPVVRSHAGALPPRARTAAGRAVRARRDRAGRDHRGHLDRPRLRFAGRTNTWRWSRRRSIIVGIQIFFSSFLLSILGLRRNV